MTFLSRRVSGVVIWGMIALALWMSFPNAGCRCANGAFKFFCNGHGQSAPSNAADLAVTEHGCCHHRRPVARADCHDKSTPLGGQVCSKGCTQLANPPAVAPVPQSSHIVPDSAVALDTVPLDVSVTLVALVATQPITDGTGPPVDLVISLHCILI